MAFRAMGGRVCHRFVWLRRGGVAVTVSSSSPGGLLRGKLYTCVPMSMLNRSHHADYAPNKDFSFDSQPAVYWL